MDVIKLLPEFLDLGVDQEEMVQIALAAVAQRIREVKLSVAQAVVQARACTMMDNLEGSNTALQQARRLQREYHEFYAQWRRLSGSQIQDFPEPSYSGRSITETLGTETSGTETPGGISKHADPITPAEELPKGDSL